MQISLFFLLFAVQSFAEVYTSVEERALPQYCGTETFEGEVFLGIWRLGISYLWKRDIDDLIDHRLLLHQSVTAIVHGI